MPFDPSSGLVDVILGVAALATAVAVVRSWGSLWDEQFTSNDRRLAAQIAVFLVPPVVVLLHELGHLVAARGLGVEVTDFRYGLFEGSVTLAGRLTPQQDWFIALAGNLVSAVAGLALVAAGVLGRRLRRPVRYVLVAGGLLELLFTLVMYPLLSFLGSFGDWIVIYDVDQTPVLAWATAAVHVAALVALWRWWRRRGRALLFTVSTGTETRVAELRGAIEASPRDSEKWLLLADFYARNGDLALARTTLDEAVAACGDVPRLHLGRARVSLFQRRWNDAVLAARRGLQQPEGAGGDGAGHDREEDVRQRLWANLALALTQMERPAHALTAYGHLTQPVADDLRVRYGRGLVRIESGDVDGGRADLEAVVARLPEGDLLRRWAEARLEGREPEGDDDGDLPAYQRAAGPPPAPIAGV